MQAAAKILVSNDSPNKEAEQKALDAKMDSMKEDVTNLRHKDAIIKGIEAWLSDRSILDAGHVLLTAAIEKLKQAKDMDPAINVAALAICNVLLCDILVAPKEDVAGQIQAFYNFIHSELKVQKKSLPENVVKHLDKRVSEYKEAQLMPPPGTPSQSGQSGNRRRRTSKAAPTAAPKSKKQKLPTDDFVEDADFDSFFAGDSQETQFPDAEACGGASSAPAAEVAETSGSKRSKIPQKK